MIVELKAETERLVREEILRGHVRSVDELIVEGVHALREKSNVAEAAGEQRTPRKTIYDLPTQPPFAGSELNPERAKEHPRAVDSCPSLFPGESKFFSQSSIEQLAASQGVKPLHDVSSLGGVLGDDEVDDFIAAIYASR